MPRNLTKFPEQNDFTLRFGGGMNTRKTPDQIDGLEAVCLENAMIDIDRFSLRRRPPILPLFVIPGASEDGDAPIDAIIGPIPDNTELPGNNQNVAFAIQSGTDIFQVEFNVGLGYWEVTATAIATIAAGSRLFYDSRRSYSYADNFGVVTDLNKKTVVKKVSYDGTNVTFADFNHNISGGPGSHDVFAKYSFIANDRVFLANIKSGTTDTPHIIAGSEGEALETITVVNRASSSLGFNDAFYIPSPDLKPINGIIEALGFTVFSTENGAMYVLEGTSSQDFFLSPLFANSGATGDESITFAGNDILYFSDGRVETLAGVQAFGDVEVDDVSRPIKKQMAHPSLPSSNAFGDNTFVNIAEASLAYLPSLNLLFVHKVGENVLWVFNKSVVDQKAKDVSLLRDGTEISGWCAWTEIDDSSPHGLLGNPNSVSRSPDFLNVFATYPIRMQLARIPIVKRIGGFGDSNWRVQETMLFGGADGVVYALDTLHDTFPLDYTLPVAKDVLPGTAPAVLSGVNFGSYAHEDETDYTPNTFIQDGQSLYPDLTDHAETCRVRYVSKQIDAPSLDSISNITCELFFIPRKGTEPEVTVYFHFKGKRERVVKKVLTLSNTEEVKNEVISLQEKPKRFSVEGRGATAFQVEIVWEDKLVELTKLHVRLKA